jgi:hypothetical protein
MSLRRTIGDLEHPRELLPSLDCERCLDGSAESRKFGVIYSTGKCRPKSPLAQLGSQLVVGEPAVDEDRRGDS